MDNNLSYEINVKKIMEILNEDTDSGVPRLDRIRLNNINLFTNINFPSEATEEVAEKLINWNNELFLKKAKTIYSAQEEIKNYCALIDLLISSIANLDIVMPSVKAFNYKNLSKVLSCVSQSSKIINRMNNLKLLCAIYQRKSTKQATKNHLYEYIIRELYAQKSFFIILNKNLEDFENENLALGLLLYDIPGNEETKPYCLNFLS